MGAFGKYSGFTGFSHTQTEQAPGEPTVLAPTAAPQGEEGLVQIAEKAKPKIVTYEDRANLMRYGGMVLGGLYHMEYTNFQHDPFPFALILSNFRSDVGCFAAINLHYLPPKVQMDVILRVLYMNNGHINSGTPFNVNYRQFKNMLRQFTRYVPYRLYKPYFIKGARYIPVHNWVNEVKRSRTILPGR